MPKGFFFRFVFITNYLHVNYFSFLDVLGLEIHHFWWMGYFSRTPGSYRYSFCTCGNRISTTIWFARHLGSLTAANRVFLDFNVAYSTCWGYSLINTLKLKKKVCYHPLVCTWFAKRMQLRSADFRFLNVFGRKIRQNLPLHSGILFASSEVMHRPRSHSPLHFDKGNI